MSLYNDLTTVLTPYATKIKQNEVGVGKVDALESTVNNINLDMNSMKTDIGAVPLFDSWDKTSGYYIATNQTSVNLSSPYTASNKYPGRCAVVPCVEGTVVKITAKGGTNLLPFGFCTSDGAWLDRADSAVVENVRVVAPEGTAYVIFNAGANNTPYEIRIGESYIPAMQQAVEDMQSVVTEAESEVNAISEVIGTPELVEWAHTANYYVQTNVSSKDVLSPYVYSNRFANKCVFMPCAPGDRFTISLLGGTRNAPFSFWTESGSRIGAGTADVQYVNAEIIAPANAAYVAFNSASGDAYGTVYKGKYKWEILEADAGIYPFKGLKGVAFGTSLTYRAQTTGGYLNYLPTMLQMDIDNQGVGSSFWNNYTDDQYDVLWNVQNYASFADKDVCIIEGCVNDWGGNRNLGTYKDTGTTSTCGCLYNMFTHIYTQNPKIQIFVVLDHYGKGDHTPEHTNQAGLTQYDFYEECAKVCNFYGIPVIKLYEYSSMGQFGEQYFLDAIHPNELGARQTANVIKTQMINFGMKITE